jgi:glycosyltransferase involved in cell wall biosynthesis
MRIGLNFHSCDTCLSGVEYYALGLLRGLLHIDSENEYFVYTNRPDVVATYVPAAANLAVLPVGHVGTRIARVLWEHTVLPHLATRRRLDVLHCTSYIGPVGCRVVPWVVTIHDTLALDRPHWCKTSNALYFRLLLKRSAVTAAGVIAVSRRTAADVCRHTGRSPQTIRVVYPGIDEIFRGDADPRRCREVRERYGLPDRYILYVGNIEPKKNIATLLAVQQALRRQGLPHKLVMAGKRSWKARRELRSIGRGVASGGVVWIGYADRGDLPFLYQMAEVFVFPSRYEGFGFPPLEAMACGTPVVCSARGALAETAAGPALIVDPGNVQEITAAVTTMITDARLRDQRIERGRRHSRRFTWTSAAEATLSLYKEAAGSHEQ